MRSADAVRTALGCLLLARPRTACRLVGEPPSPTTDVVTRILGARMLAQATIGVLVGRRSASARRRVALADTAVEALHGVSMLAAAGLLPRRRRLSLTSAAVAGCFALADHVVADSSAAAERPRLIEALAS